MRAAVLAATLVAAALAGCGGDDRAGGRISLLLDFAPNAVHAGIFTALERDFDGAESIDLRVRAPSSSTDSVRLLESGRADLAVLDITDLAIARARGRDVVGVMALVQRPLAAVLAQPGIRTPRDLEGRRAGVSGLPSDVAVLRSIVAGAGGDPRRVRRVTIGFNAVPALLGRRVSAATAFWNAEGVALRRRRPGIREFRVDEYGAPGYPELVLCVSGVTLEERGADVRAVVAALRRGYAETLNDPERAVGALLARNRGLRREAVAAELRAVSPAFTAGVPRPGVLDRARLRAWSRWAVRFGIVRRRPDVDRAFAFDVANG